MGNYEEVKKVIDRANQSYKDYLLSIFNGIWNYIKPVTVETQKPILNLDQIQSQLRNKSKWENEMKKAEKIQNRIEKLKSDPDFRTQDQIRELKQNVKEVEDMIESFKKINIEVKSENNQCPVCCETPDSVFSCENCNNWICGNCKDQVENCPQCREDLNERPLRRNKALEQHLLL